MLYLHALGHFHPPNIVTNRFLEDLDIGVDENWILERVGIRERRTNLSLDYIKQTKNIDPRAAAEASQYTNAETSKLATELALQRASLQPSDIGMVIAGSCSPQSLIPAEACSIAAALGISGPAFDVNSACSSFAAQLNIVNMMDPEQLPDFILLVQPESTTRRVNYTDRRTAVLWGDGTSAAILSPRRPSPNKITFATLDSDPSGWNKITISEHGHFTQDGHAVQNFAIRKTSATIENLVARCSATGDDISWFIGHQANLMMLRSVCTRMGITEESHLYNVDQFGNCGAAGAPSVLSQNWDQLSDGWLAMAVVGSGLSWGGVLFHFNSAKAASDPRNFEYHVV